MHNLMLSCYRTMDWDGAQDALNTCMDMPGANLELYELYAERIYQFTFDPPPSGWGGVFVATTK
ncbi:unnamed protein product [Laminaria digitata]